MNFYGWSKLNTKPFVPHLGSSKSFSILAACSQLEHYGFMATEGTVNAEVVLKYLKSLIRHKSDNYSKEANKFVICWDNASVHKKEEINEFLLQSEATMVTIAPYSPWLNPVESLIGAIKKKILSKHGNWKELSLRMIQQSIDEAWETDPNKFFSYSLDETKATVLAYWNT